MYKPILYKKNRNYDVYLGYLHDLNSILNYLNYDYKYTKEELIDHIDIFPIAYRDQILFNVSAVLNHELFFSVLGDNVLNGKVYDMIISDFGSYDAFKEEFKRQANLLVGSGYTFLVLNKDKLMILNMSNEDSPYSFGYVPIVAIDLWEHAYFDYDNRTDYILDFFSMLDFRKVDDIYEKAKK